MLPGLMRPPPGLGLALRAIWETAIGDQFYLEVVLPDRETAMVSKSMLHHLKNNG